MAARHPFARTHSTIRRPPVGRPRPKKDRETPRLFTRLHLPGSSPVASFRLVAELVHGQEVPVYVGHSWEEVVSYLRTLGDQPFVGTVALRVQRWVGCASRGRWEDVR
jgi:hypothetical protein